MAWGIASGRASLWPPQTGRGVEPQNARVPAAWRHFEAGDSGHERAMKIGLGIQRSWLTRGEVCGHVALLTAGGIHSPAVMSLAALPVRSWSALPESKMLPQWFLTSFSVFRANLPGNGSPPSKLPLPELWAEILPS